MAATPSGPRTRDGCAVATAPLAELIEAFALKRGTVLGVNPLAWLAERTTETPGAGVSRRQILRLLKRERELTDLRVADALVVAMGDVGAFYDGTLEIVPRKPGCCRVYGHSVIAAALACRA